jgi:hypothetical protein
MLRVTASFENEAKRNVITRNFQRVFYTFKSLFSSRVSGGIPLRVNYV